MKDIEVLAPAGNYQSFLSAINNGADAVYLGLNDFNARGNIENFTTNNLQEVVKKAHLFGVKVYMTLNTLVQDSEIEDVLALVRKSIDFKVDAFIVQDVGLAHLLSNTFEGIELHASTQMGLQNLEGVEFVKKLGYSRVVLARETPINEIKRIKDNSNLEIEYFVQGALCVAFSGNCYLCSLIAGASGNRGKCKQFCRLPWNIKYGENVDKNGYLLSTKDFCNLPYLKEMVEAGVTSLKIEGRARRSAYVGGVTAVYRKAVDDHFKYKESDVTTLKKLFNRGGYISGYFKDDKIIYPTAQNHIGIEIGKVLAVNKGKKFNEITVFSLHEVKKGDSLKFFDNEKEISSVNVFDVRKVGKDKYIFTTTSFVSVGAKVNLIVDKNLEDEILNKKKKINLTACIHAKVGERASLFMRADKVSVSIKGEEKLEESKTQPLTKEECYAQISKLGENYILTDLECNIENVFMRKALLNDLRRKCLEILEEEIIKNNEKNIKIIEKSFKLNKNDKKIKKNNKKIYIFDNLNKLKDNFNDFDYFIYSPDKYDKNEIIEFCDTNKDKIIYLDLPVIVTRADMNLFREIYSNCSNLGVYANNYYAFSFTTPDKTIISPEMNVFNSYAIDFYIKQGYNKIVLSKEFFNFDNIASQNAEVFMLSDVNQKYMYFKHCPIKEHIGGDCSKCKFNEGIEYKLEKKKFLLKRKKAITCQFYLVDKAKTMYEIYERFGQVVEILE